MLSRNILTSLNERGRGILKGGAPRSEFKYAMIAGGNHTKIHSHPERELGTPLKPASFSSLSCRDKKERPPEAPSHPFCRRIGLKREAEYTSSVSFADSFSSRRSLSLSVTAQAVTAYIKV